MSDGLTDGYRMERQNAERARRLAKFGTELCYVCSKDLLGAAPVTDAMRRERYRHVLEGRQEHVYFCSEQCLQVQKDMLEVVEKARKAVADTSLSVAFRTSARELIRQVAEGYFPE